jgi:hypothetical protein
VRVRRTVVLLTTLALVVAGGTYLAVRVLQGGLALNLRSQECTASAGGTVTLDPEQMANAATIAAVGIRRGVPTRAVAVALAASLQESKLRNLPGGDRDSVGLFQQRPSQGWGTPSQVSDPRYAAGRFYTALLRVHGWQRMQLTAAAQAVQRSADGSAYERWSGQATILAAALVEAASDAVSCVITARPARTGAAAAVALAHGVALDWGAVNTVADASLLGVTLSVSDARSGWQYAHWLVAHSVDQAVESVQFGNRMWTAKQGAWKPLRDPGPAAGSRVIARVYSRG